MQIYLNGTHTDVPDDLGLSALIERLGVRSERFAVEVNEAVIPRSALAEHRLAPEDRVEIIQAIGGG
jgi:sulfur carrier protein